jgi:hypothetical protein
MAAAVNNFLPNAVPFINSGMEVHERQPMNLGLDIVPPGRYALPKSDPYYGKLAFFDRFVLHWDNPGTGAFVAMLRALADVRSRFVADLAKASNYVTPTLRSNRTRVLALGIRVNRGRERLLVLASTDFARRRRTTVVLPPRSRARPEVLFATRNVQSSSPRRHQVRVDLPPGGVFVLLAQET